MAVPELTSTADPRKERARATRRRMVTAAYRLFCERGYQVPLTAIAAEAGVAVQTLYFTFHSKVELLGEALQYAVLGDDLPTPPHERPWFAEMSAEPDALRSIAIVLRNTQAIYDRLAPFAGVFQTGHPDTSAMWRHSEELRHAGMGVMTRALLTKGAPRADLATATDIVFVMLGMDTYRAFVIDRGWSPERWRDWTAATLVCILFQNAE